MPPVLQIDGCVYQFTPASRAAPTTCAARSLRSADVTPLHRYYEPSRHRLAFRRLPGGARTVSPVFEQLLLHGSSFGSSQRVCRNDERPKEAGASLPTL